MPELPEVEYTARQLRAQIVGATIRNAQVFWERIIGHPAPADFLAEVADREISAVRRRGKFLVLDLSGDLFLSIHRRMTGNLLLLPPGWEIDTSLREVDPLAWSTRGPTFRETPIEEHSAASGQANILSRLKPITDKETSYCRICFNLADGRRLLFTDQRKFGRIELWPCANEEEAFRGLGPEPLSDTFTPERLQSALAGRKSALKTVLLAQEVVAGLGNIYADEALYYAFLHPLRRANSLTIDEIRLLHEGIVSVLTLGIEHGGTSFSDYRDLWGEAGDNYNHVRVYQQDGRPCMRCGTTIERIVLAQRSAHFCPTCQKLTAVPIAE
ncbi:MAG TPA: bifunctional DNA-formamidopyrimidine glycosylase/DNA-(apurinic or apyrimidinic site) lyase [Ktedonobacteraceae bacterium]|nr:bifunctional DNA-formamidopyrimidine glycosylase/DNA-(apurinic or apyrimidinic site) lyase [Ktedonobacteraceae bacterium]